MGKTSIALVVVIIAVAGVGLYLQSQKIDQLTADLGNQQALVQSLRQQLEARTSALHEEIKRDLPVTLAFRKAFLAPGLVAVFRNTSGHVLEVAATFNSPSTGQQHEANLVIRGGGFEELGSRQGWAFAPGQHIKLSNSEYRPLEYVVP